jgi:hypothetical protein
MLVYAIVLEVGGWSIYLIFRNATGTTAVLAALLGLEQARLPRILADSF